MQGTLWEWNVEKLEGVPSQILVTCPLQAVMAQSERQRDQDERTKCEAGEDDLI